MKKGNFFQYVVGLSALLVAGSAAYYSVFGLSKLFSGAMFAVVVMAGSLEFAKLVSASFLYRYWTKVNTWLKYYMTVGVVILVLITSAGIFGFLSNAYQGATIEFEKQSTVLLYKEDRLSQLQEDKTYLKEELELAISELPDNYITAKRKLRADYNPKVLEVNDEILDIKSEIGDLKTALIETGVDVGPAIYLARIFGTDIDTVVKFFIFILIFVFDPMAVSLVIAYNRILEDRSTNSNITITNGNISKPKKKWWEVYGESKDKILKREKIGVEDKPEEVVEKVINTGKKDEKIGRGGVAGR